MVLLESDVQVPADSVEGGFMCNAGAYCGIVNEVDTWQIHGRYVVDRYPSLFGGNQDG